MTLPEKDPRGYLEIATVGSRAIIAGEAPHIAELEGLLKQRGVPCSRLQGGAGWESLELDPGADRAAAQEVLDGYKAARGS